MLGEAATALMLDLAVLLHRSVIRLSLKKRATRHAVRIVRTCVLSR